MKKTIVLLLLALTGFALPGNTQHIVPGERAPELKIQNWIDGKVPAPAPRTYVEFFHSSCKASAESVERLGELSRHMGDKLRIVIIVCNDDQKAAEALRPHLSDSIGAGIDPEGKLFAAYGVHYIPFGVLLGPRNRVLWMGNSRQLTPEIIEKSE